MAEIEHGTYQGVHFHHKHGEKLCPTCATVDTDRQRAWRVSSGKGKTVHVGTRALAEILRGADPAVALANEIGPQTLAALRKLGAGEQRG